MSYHTIDEYSDFSDWYNIEKRGEFFIEVTNCKRIEDLTDAFISKEDLVEKYKTGYWHSPGGNGRWYRGDRILAVVEEWTDLLGEEKISTTLRTSEAKIMMMELTPDEINRFIPSSRHIRVNSDRIIDERREHNRKQERAEEEHQERARQYAIREAQPYERVMHNTESDIRKLMSGCLRAVKQKYGITGSVDSWHRFGTKRWEYFKRLLSWTDIARALRIELPKKQHKLDLKFIKQIWDNPPGA